MPTTSATGTRPKVSCGGHSYAWGGITGTSCDRRSGLTLVEVCLVLALLVVIGAISAPMLGGSFSRAELHGASDLLRGAWSRGRLAAMESGQTYVFRFQPNGRAYQIVTLSDLGALGAEAVPVEAWKVPSRISRRTSCAWRRIACPTG